MYEYELINILSRIRAMALAAREFHLRGLLWPPARHLGFPPEHRKDNRSDIYCLGAALIRQLPVEMRGIPPDAAQVLQTLRRRTLCPVPQGRYSCCEELLQDLDRVIQLLDSTESLPPEKRKNPMC